MKVYIFSDLEGITGVSCRGHVLKDMPEYADGCKFMADDINACIEGCFQGGATEVLVRDGHGAGTNLEPKAIDSRASLYQGPSTGGRFPCFEGSDALILLGYHAKAGTPGAVLEHTYSSRNIQNIWLNGKKAGEATIDAAIAAEYRVPVILVSGDDKTAVEVAEDMPGVPFCQVKTSFGLEEAVSLPFAEAHQKIIKMTAAAVRRYREIPVIRVSYPVTMRMELMERVMRQPQDVVFPYDDDYRIYEKTGDSVEEVLFRIL